MDNRKTNVSHKSSTYINTVKKEKQNKVQFHKCCISSTVAVVLGLVLLVCVIVLFTKIFDSVQEIQILENNLKTVRNNTKNDTFILLQKFQEKYNDFINCLQNCYNGRCVTAENKFVCLCNNGYTGNNCNKRKLPKIGSCQSANVSGIYLMKFNESRIEVYCEVKPGPGNKWLVIQRRFDGSENFYRNWSDYQRGFGNKNREFWMGLDILHGMTKFPQSYQLRIDLEDWYGNTRYAAYKLFRIGNSDSNYTLTVRKHSGTARDSLNYNKNQPFTTKDHDNDGWSKGNCAVRYHGAWWYKSCYAANLNGKYFRNEQINRKGVVWRRWPRDYYSLKAVQMKIRPNAIN